MPKILAYQGFDRLNNPNVVVASLTEPNAPPLLILWLYFTTNPDFLDSTSPNFISQQAQFDAIGAKLGISGQCVMQVFKVARDAQTQAAVFTPVTTLFQDMTKTMSYRGHPPTCIASDTILSLAPTAKAAAARAVAQPATP